MGELKKGEGKRMGRISLVNSKSEQRKGGLFRPVVKMPVMAAIVSHEPDTPLSLPTHHEDELLTDADVMAILKVKKQWLRDHTTRVLPIVPHIKMGREIRYSKRAIQAWIMSQQETRPTWERTEKAA